MVPSEQATGREHGYKVKMERWVCLFVSVESAGCFKAGRDNEHHVRCCAHVRAYVRARTCTYMTLSVRAY